MDDSTKEQPLDARRLIAGLCCLGTAVGCLFGSRRVYGLVNDAMRGTAAGLKLGEELVRVCEKLVADDPSRRPATLIEPKPDE